MSDYRLAGDAQYNQYEFESALRCYQHALQCVSKENDQQVWSEILNDIGRTHGEIGVRTNGDRIHHSLAAAVTAYRDALTVRTREHLPEEWAQTHNNLAKTCLALEDWEGVTKSYRNVLTLYPDDGEAYLSAHAVYHEKLFAYASAFELSRQWVERHPEDVSAQANFAEAHLTTGRYGEAERRLVELLKNPDLDPGSTFGLRIVEIVTLFALKKGESFPTKLQELRRFVAGQPERFQVEWSFAGLKHFIETEELFAPHRSWLSELFSVAEAKDRSAILGALDRAQSRLSPNGTR